MKNLRKAMQNLAMLGQLGLSFIMPTLLCILLCVFLTGKYDIGGWIYIPGFFFGLGGSFMTAYKFYLSVMDKERKDKSANRTKINFNDHI